VREKYGWLVADKPSEQGARYIKGKAICYLCDLEQLLTRIFSSPISLSFPTPASLGFGLGFRG
jgi:hypothetical protein